MRASTLALCTMLFTMGLHAADRCDAILRGGIFDTADVLDLYSRYETVRKVACGSETDFAIDDSSAFLSTSDFCNQDFRNVVVRDDYVKSIRRASNTIASAWVECLKQEASGLFHYFTTTKDPTRFQYTILFKSVGEPRTSKLKNWIMTPAPGTQGVTCKGKVPKKDVKSVDDTGITLDCIRPEDVTITVAVNAVSGKADPVVLPAVEHAYVVAISDVDYVGKCFLTNDGGGDVEVLSQLYGRGRISLFLNPKLSASATPRLRCQIDDNDATPNGCWSARFEIIRDGITLVDSNNRCCWAGCPGGERAWNQTFPILVVPRSPQ